MIMEIILDVLHLVTGILPFVLFFVAKARNIPFYLEVAGLLMFYGSTTFLLGAEYDELTSIAMKIALIIFVVHVAIRKHERVQREKECNDCDEEAFARKHQAVTNK